jgi:hypothetical protein
MLPTRPPSEVVHTVVARTLPLDSVGAEASGPALRIATAATVATRPDSEALPG